MENTKQPENINRVIETLKKTALFHGLDEDVIKQLSSQVVTRQFPKNSIVVTQGDETDSLYVIIEGKVDVFLQNDKGKEIIINTLGECDSFGELAPLGGLPRQASIITTENSMLVVISRQVFMDTLLTKPAISMRIINRLINLIKDLTEEVSSLALEDVYNRVVRVLYKHAEEIGDKLVTEKLTQQDIALRVGATREMVHRILKELKTGGYISIEGKHITIEKKLPPGW
ncbi:MAG: Crp/Fnr family transcriptional regulator [Gammaproteobacteria bacterium]|jgi:CRP/FNR family cyclic AMP-dependent transcriptional regulator|nr:Crp/Fnr family transcriptional regulator [Gammaproteobacteria bacterium]MBT3721775.1 Crp/Fnr family transcriptional regulator [Gammaproteobacteria bacterium]MBT4074945.1 Crp/Fnr family transcriptional regulator [Gammaproteobacteria bacterium]MBT4193079.1 Crp/Fnr family transcriptional regulator [Gammaproteobacteria bacterium]MBT4450625.1 Crp/Fnr family transcriptional regulator [Gammaproteobacteria bacterium]